MVDGCPDGCATIVARDDPHLHATALFAPEPARADLMALYAFDIELSRATRASSEPLIPRMRLQWWRDVAEAARDGAPAPAHEVAGPFARLITRHRLPAEPVETLLDAHEIELDAGQDARFDEARFSAWADGRFGALAALAARVLGGGPETVALARRTGPVLGAAFVFRHAAAMAGEGRVFFPGLTPDDRAALMQGELTAHAHDAISRLAADARARLAALRAERRRVDRRAVPAFLPLLRAGRILDRAARLAAEEDAAPSGSAPVAAGELDGARPFAGLRLAWAAASGRW